MSASRRAWHLPPDGTVWILDWQDRTTAELLGSLEFAGERAAQISRTVLARVRPASPADLMAGPIVVDHDLGADLQEMLGLQLSLDEHDYYLGIFQAGQGES